MNAPTVSGSDHPALWTGQAAIGFGIGAFLGQSGHNDPHQHAAHQLTMSLDPSQTVKVVVAHQRYEAPVLFIPANTTHQLAMGYYLSVYIDPYHPLISRLHALIDTTQMISEVSLELQQQLYQSFLSNQLLTASLSNFLYKMQTGTRPPSSSKIHEILALLYQGMLQAQIPDRQSLAQVAGLSESRFSHWFREQAGLPLRRYRKWLRLISGITQMQQGQALTDIAHQAAFADQAHFTRTCIELFGVRPSALSEMQGNIFLIP